MIWDPCYLHSATSPLQRNLSRQATVPSAISYGKNGSTRRRAAMPGQKQGLRKTTLSRARPDPQTRQEARDHSHIIVFVFGGYLLSMRKIKHRRGNVLRFSLPGGEFGGFVLCLNHENWNGGIGV